MLRTCVNVLNMSKMIQIRNVPDELHRKLKVRAAQKGMTLSDYLLAEIEDIAALPTIEEFVERVRQLPAAKLDRPPHELIREARDAVG